jgi:hypothetical protein
MGNSRVTYAHTSPTPLPERPYPTGLRLLHFPTAVSDGEFHQPGHLPTLHSQLLYHTQHARRLHTYAPSSSPGRWHLACYSIRLPTRLAPLLPNTHTCILALVICRTCSSVGNLLNFAQPARHKNCKALTSFTPKPAIIDPVLRGKAHVLQVLEERAELLGGVRVTSWGDTYNSTAPITDGYDPRGLETFCSPQRIRNLLWMQEPLSETDVPERYTGLA